MNPILKLILGIVVGLIVGSLVNFIIILFSAEFVPIPEGINPMDPESLKANMHRFQAHHYLTPFLAHAIGTFVGALVAIKISPHEKEKISAYVVAGVFFIGGVINAVNLPFPTWFVVVDLVVAYFLMGWLALKVSAK